MTKRSIKVRERVNRIWKQMEDLNTELGEPFELGYRGRNHRICLIKDGEPVAYGLKAIEEHLYWEKWYKDHWKELANHDLR